MMKKTAPVLSYKDGKEVWSNPITCTFVGDEEGDGVWGTQDCVFYDLHYRREKGERVYYFEKNTFFNGVKRDFEYETPKDDRGANYDYYEDTNHEDEY